MIINEFILEALKKRLEEAEAIARNLKLDIGALEIKKDDIFKFRVHIHSFWSGEGESNVTLNYTGTLEEALRRAIKMFKTRNKRTDIQGTFLVQVFLPNGSWLEIPSKFYMKSVMKLEHDPSDR